MIQGKKVYIAIAAGGVYTEGPLQSYDFVTPYLKTILGFIGLTDMTIQWAEGLAIPGIQESALEKSVNSIVL